MRYSRLFTFLIVLLSAFTAKADVFTVTSNADSGPGTLREALTLAAANGSAVKDFINFNLPDLSEAGRTITLFSELPPVSLNLIIDGSSQPGFPLGVSSAKITIAPKITGSINHCFVIDYYGGDRSLGIYGLYISGFKSYALHITSVCVLNLGAPGKGNVFTDNGSVLDGGISNSIFKSNFIGVMPDGKTFKPNITDVFYGGDFNNLLVGGDAPEDGNIIANGGFTFNPNPGNTLVTFKNNFFGTDYTGTQSLTEFNQGVINLNSGTTATIFNNVFSATWGTVNIDNGSTGIFKGNFFGTDRSEQFQLGRSNGNAIYLGRGGIATIGGKDNADQNVFTNYFSPIASSNFIKCNVIKNHFYCNDEVRLLPYYFDDRVNIKSLTNNLVAGHAPPNSVIQLYYSRLKCTTTCNPEEWFANTTTDKDGNWKYEGPINGKVMVSASYDGNTIGFAPLGLYAEDAKVTDVTCSHLGSIELIENLVGRFTFEWKDINGKVIGHNQNITGLVAGRYTLEVSEDGTCPSMVGYFYVVEQPSEVFPETVSLACDKATATLTASYVGFENIPEFSWEDKSGTVVSTKSTAENLSAGIYYLTIKNANGCNSGKVAYEVKPAATAPAIDESKLDKKNSGCGRSDGYIRNIILTPGHYNYLWTNDKQEFAGNTLDLNGVPAGRYTLFISYSSTCLPVTTSTFEIIEISDLAINQTNRSVGSSSCGQPTGSIKGITTTGAGALKYSWKNAQNVEVGTVADLVNQPPGDYILTVSDGSPCGTLSTQPITITVLNDISIDVSAKDVQPATCDNFDGSIRNIAVTGISLTYKWTNDKGIEFGSEQNLSGAPAGTYTLTVTGQNYCNPVVSEPIIITSINGVALDLSGQGGRSATCNESNGSITGLKTTNASTYQWTITGTNTVKSTQIDLTNVPAGFYTLTISNATCSKSYDFEVVGFPPTVFTGITYTSTKSCQAFNTGTLTANTDNANAQPLKYRWVNSAGENVGFDKLVPFLPPGTYKLYLTDNNYCENLYRDDYVVAQYPEFKVASFGTVANTQCGVGVGGVSGITVSGGTGNYTYQWLDADNNDSPLPGKTQPALANVLKGHYKLRITDGGCSLAEIPYTIIDEAVTPPSPSANNIQVYNTGPAVIKVNSPFPTAIYRLYETATSAQPIKDTIGGNINISVTESRSYYVSLTYGYCESARTEVKVFLSALNGNIPNTFTPNGDGINDYWNIPGLDTYPNATVKIFNRYGTPVFQSIGYAKPFDGTSNGKPLPVGVYYYIITLKKGDVLSGNVTIVR